MSEKLEELKEVMETLEKTKEEIENKYNEIDKKINENDIKLRPLELHITRLKEELQEVEPSDLALVAEYEKSIKEALNSQERQDLLKEKEELLKEKAEHRLDNEKNKKIELRQAEDDARKALTQEKGKIETEIMEVDAEMQMQLIAMSEFKYEYEEKDGVRIPLNGNDMKEIHDKYNELADKKERATRSI